MDHKSVQPVNCHAVKARPFQITDPCSRFLRETWQCKPVMIRKKRRGLNMMARTYYRSIFDELNYLRTYMDSLVQQIGEPTGITLLPTAGSQTKMLPAAKSNLKVDVTDRGSEIVVTADIIAGVGKKDISIDLINPQALEISCERREEKKEEKEGYYMRERTFGSMTRVIPLPRPVTDEGAKAVFKNGIVEIHLKKMNKETGSKIAIE